MNRIKDLRLKKGLKQAELANMLGVSQATLSNWERGDFEPDNKSIVNIADYFCVPTDFLLGRIDGKITEHGALIDGVLYADPNKPLPDGAAATLGAHTVNFGPSKIANTVEVSRRHVTELPDELKGMKLGFEDGALDGLDEDDIEMLREMANQLRKRKEKAQGKQG